MKTKHLIGTALLASALLFSCKPQHEDEKYRLTVITCCSFMDRPGHPPCPPVPSLIRIYKKTAYIHVDTVPPEDWAAVGDVFIYTFPDKELVCQSSIIDTIHTVYIPSGEYILSCLYFPYYDTNGRLRYSPHFSRIGVLNDTMVSDTLRSSYRSDYDKLYQLLTK